MTTLTTPMQYLNPYIVTSLDYFGKPYTHTVLLTPQAAAVRIVNGRLLTVAEGNARNYGQLWDRFKALGKQPGSGYVPQGYVEVQSNKQLHEDEK